MKNLNEYEQKVSLKFQIYNSLFLTIPLTDVKNTANLLPILHEYCRQELGKNKSPQVIIDQFFAEYKSKESEEEHWKFLFLVIQYVERQIVLIDALEDAAFDNINDIHGDGSIINLITQVQDKGNEKLLLQTMNHFSIRVVLTAHPTQFYPSTILALITDLTEAIQKNDFNLISTYLNQLGRTPFFQRAQPTPFTEAVNLIWYLENIFYHSVGDIIDQLKIDFPHWNYEKPLIHLGFWPGGDRDGNPFVTTDITKKVASRLHRVLLNCYYRHLRKLRRRISFRNAHQRILDIEQYVLLCIEQRDSWDLQKYTTDLMQLREELTIQHDGLFRDLLDQLIDRVALFGSHFASLDIRQDSKEIEKAFEYVVTQLSLNQDCIHLLKEKHKIPATQIDQLSSDLKKSDTIYDTLQTFITIREIQKQNGEMAAHRYIISECHESLDIIRSYLIARWTAFPSQPIPIDFVPLFEKINDLVHATTIIQELYKNPIYREHLKNRSNSQTIMLGFSDGTKDGGYLTANWQIYKAKENITRLSRGYGINILFFDGRGGPPARGGGKTHNFYTSLGSDIASSQIQLTIQGQTISSKFGTIESARFNMEQLLTAGITNLMTSGNKPPLDESDHRLLDEMSKIAQNAYRQLRERPEFLRYLETISPLHYYSLTNIASRPVQRGGKSTLNFDDLRAIPFVSSWSQLKQNIAGYYGLGITLEVLKERNLFGQAQSLYQNSLFFRTLIDNSMQSMCKTFFPLTYYLHNNSEFGDFWQTIHNEFKRAQANILELSGQKTLLENNPLIRSSITLRESIVLPLLVIQQYALIRLRNSETTPRQRKVLEKLVLRSLSGNINAARNSA